MKIKSIIGLLFFLNFSSISQTILNKVVADSKTKLPIEFVNIYSENKKVNLLSTLTGKFTINRELNVKTYIFNKTGYLVKSVSNDDLLKFDTIFLTEKPVELGEIDITVNKLEEVVKDKRFYVDDYLVLPNYDFLIITYKINIKGFEVCYYKKNHGITCTKKIKTEYNQHLFKDCFSNYHLLTNACSRQFYFTSDSTFDFLTSYRRTFFDSTLARVVLKVDSELIYKRDSPPSNYKGTYFSSTLYPLYLSYIGRKHNKITDLYTVVYNKHMREMLQSENRDSKMNSQTAEVIGSKGNGLVGYKTQTREFGNGAQSIEASESLFLECLGPIYAPIYNKNDTLIVLNFQEDEIAFIDKNGILLKTVKMDDFARYHNFQAYYDEIAQRFYITVVESNMHNIKRLNIYTGKFERTEHLERPFPKNIQIVNNKMYFQVKEHEWDDTSYIYLQNL